jgi:hypothetical protein
MEEKGKLYSPASILCQLRVSEHLQDYATSEGKDQMSVRLGVTRWTETAGEKAPVYTRTITKLRL